jgi:hypothetical protein
MDGVVGLHEYLGFIVPFGFLAMSLWAFVGVARNRTPSAGFWRLLAGVQVVLGLQIVVGGILFLSGHRPASNGPQWLHYAYGGLFPIVVLIYAHRYARRAQGLPWLVFGIAGLVAFGLTFRAMQTGLGID